MSFTLHRARLLSQVDGSIIVIITVCFSLNVSIFSRISQSNLCIMITILTFTDKFIKTLFIPSCSCLNVRLFFKNAIYWPYTCEQEGKTVAGLHQRSSSDLTKTLLIFPLLFKRLYLTTLWVKAQATVKNSRGFLALPKCDSTGFKNVDRLRSKKKKRLRF